MNLSLRAGVLALLVLTPVSGCFGGDDASPASPTPTDSGNETVPVVLTLVLGNMSTAPNHKTPVFVEWRVDSNTNESIPLDLAEIAYGNASVDADNLTNDTAYPGRAGNETSPAAPGSYNTTFEIATPGPVYLRAHVIYQGEHFWSEEAMLTVAIAKGTVQKITYPAGAITGQAKPTPANPTIKRGDGIHLTNSDQVGHNLVCAANAPQACTIGTTAAGATSAAVYLTTPGTYSFSCTLHPTTMTSFGSFTVSNQLN